MVTFVTRKITRGIARINEGIEECLYMGNIDALRDWGHARDYVEMQWLMLQQDKPTDFVIATGRQESVRTFIELSAKSIGWEGIIWEGKGVKEVGRRADNNQIVIRIDPKYYRPAEVQTLLGDPSLAKEKLGWSPSTTLEELVNEMILVTLTAKKIRAITNQGFKYVVVKSVSSNNRHISLEGNSQLSCDLSDYSKNILENLLQLLASLIHFSERSMSVSARLRVLY